mgnify:CR=1 FL=1
MEDDRGTQRSDESSGSVAAAAKSKDFMAAPTGEDNLTNDEDSDGDDAMDEIRRMLTETSVRASDRRAVFVGVEAYETAGGPMLQDLFQGDDGGWLEDLPCSIVWSARSFRLKPKPLRPKVGNGSRSRSTCPMATATVCGG